MSQISPDLLKSAASQGLAPAGYQIDEMVLVSASADRLLQTEKLQSAVESLFPSTNNPNTNNEDLPQLYIVSVSKRKKTSSSAPSSSENGTQSPHGDLGPLYANEGELNTPYLLKNAQMLLNAGEYALAKSILLALVRSHRHSAEVFQGLAQCFEFEKDFPAAEDNYQKAILYHASGFAYQRLAQLQFRLGRFQSSAETLERFLPKLTEHSSEHAEICNKIAESYLRAGQMKLAETWIRKSLANNGSDPTAQNHLAKLLIERGQFDSAKIVLEKLLLQTPNHPETLTAFGTLQFKTGEKKQALETLAKSLDHKIYQPEALSLLIRCAYEIRSFATAARITEDYCDSAPVSIPLLYALAGLQFHLGRFEDLQITNNQILSIDPNHLGIKDLVKRADKLSKISH